jgi:hypothetical protein
MAMEFLELAGLSITKLRSLFSSLPPIDVHELDTVYRAELIGPLWLRRSAGPALSLTGLRGWWGKDFSQNNIAYNLINTADGIKPKLQMEMRMAPSPFDGTTTTLLTYPLAAPIPWRYVSDELRRLDETRILAMTFVNRPLFYRIAFPFILCRQENYRNGL